MSIHPPFSSIATVKAAIEADHIPLVLGAQTCHFADTGAYTGEVSAGMLAVLKVRYVIAGHSERRAQSGETDEVVRDKVDAIYRNAMQPILCVGETADERQVASPKRRRVGKSPRRSSHTSRSGPLVPARRPRPRKQER